MKEATPSAAKKDRKNATRKKWPASKRLYIFSFSSWPISAGISFFMDIRPFLEGALFGITIGLFIGYLILAIAEHRTSNAE
jgi:hypothetical protein